MKTYTEEQKQKAKEIITSYVESSNKDLTRLTSDDFMILSYYPEMSDDLIHQVYTKMMLNQNN